jgi:hypothetical protein
MNILAKLFVLYLGILFIPAVAFSQGAYNYGSTPAEYQCGTSCCLVCDYEPCYYSTWRCEMVNQVQQVQKCRYIPQYSEQVQCCYVPQYYTQTSCTYVPQYYYENVCTPYPHWVNETNCKMVPKYTYRIR